MLRIFLLLLIALPAAGEVSVTFDPNAARPQLIVRGVADTQSLAIRDLTSGQGIAADALKHHRSESFVAVTFDGLENGIPADGRYEVTLDGKTYTFSFLYGDLNDDGVVNTADFNILSGNFGNVAVQYRHGDMNYDGVVDSKDVTIFTSRHGNTLPATQPATAPSTQPGQ